MRLILCALIAVAAVGCSTTHHASSAAPPTTSGSTTTSLYECHGCRPIGTITGRYYADGGPFPPEPPHAIPGTITVTNVATREFWLPGEDARGYFSLAVPPGTYEVVGRSRDIASPTKRTATVAAGKTVNADLGIHMI
jgi:hypothetical protein